MTDTDADGDTHVTRLFGGPGSGKTTELLDRVEAILERDDVEMNDVLLVSYTRAAAAEVRERLADRLEVTPASLQGNVCTMHAKAYELLNLSRGDVVGESDKEAFCEDYGLEYEDEYSGSRRRTARSTALGNKIIATSQWLQRTGRDVADWYDVPFQWNDETVRLPPEIDDRSLEGNKYTPTWPSDDDRVDVPESIRAWRAYKGEDVILDTSHRLPSEILELVQREIRHIDNRQEKNLKPRKEGGSVEAVESPSVLDLVRNVRATVQEDDGSIMVLFRARYQLFQFVDEFITEGIPFTVLTDQRMWTDRLDDYVTAVEALGEDEPVDGLQARRLADMLMDSAFGTSERDELFDAIDEREEAEDVDDLREIEFTADEIREFAPFLPDTAAAADMVRKVTRYQKKSMKSYFANPAYHEMARDRVRIGTIHSAKGREADHVFVATDLTEKVVEQMAASVPDPTAVPGVGEFTAATSPVPVLTDNERRVFYVGMSRARERLVVLENLIDGAPTLPLDVLLNNEPSEETAEEVIGGVEPAAPQ